MGDGSGQNRFCRVGRMMAGPILVVVGDGTHGDANAMLQYTLLNGRDGEGALRQGWHHEGPPAVLRASRENVRVPALGQVAGRAEGRVRCRTLSVEL